MSRRTLIIAGAGVVVGLFILVFFVTRGRQPVPPLASPSASPDITLFPNPASDTPLFSPTPITTASPGATNACLALRADLTDNDLDLLPDILESTYGTDMNVADTDGDGVTDGEEVRSGHDPRVAGAARLDSDGDGLLENEECSWNTNPANPDTDGDGFTDGAEVRNCFDPVTKGDGQGSDKLRNCPSVLPTISPTPPPTTAPTTRPTATAFPTSAPPSTTLPKVEKRELTITTDTSAAAVRAYLVAADAVPVPFGSDGQLLIEALQSAIVGDSRKLTDVRAGIHTYTRALLAIPTPENALPYHELHIALTRYIYEKLGVMESAAEENPAAMEQAAWEIVTDLPQYLADLQAKRAILDAVALETE